MQDQEAREIVSELIKQAEENDNLEFQQITNWGEYRYYLQQEKALKVVIKILKACTKATFKAYCKEVSLGAADFNKLLACVQLQDIIAYYEQNLKVVIEMNTEYDNHLGNWGNFVKEFILGYEREDW